MARTINTQEHAARRDAILDAAQQLILSKGSQRMTVQDILDGLQISKGAFYHYFDSKPAVVQALIERLVGDAERALTPIVSDSRASATEKLQGVFAEIVRWRTERQKLFVAVLPSWYAPDNIAFRRQVDQAVAQRLSPMFTSIILEGVDEQSFTVSFPRQAGAVVMALAQATQDALAERLLALPGRQPNTAAVTELAAIRLAHLEAIERYLGVPPGTLNQATPEVVAGWVSATLTDSTTEPK